MAMGGIDHQHVDAGIEQRLGALDAVIARAGRRGDAQPALVVLAGMGKALRLLDVLHRDEADAAIGVVDHQQLLDAMLVQEAHRLLALHGFAHGDQLVAGHQLGDRLARVVGEAHVAVGDDADQPLRAGLDHRDAGDAVVGHQLQRVGQRLVGPDGDGVHHHAGLEFLDLAHLVRLLGNAEIAVDDAEPARLRHGDGKRALRHRIHRRRDERNAEAHLAREPGPGICLGGEDRRGRRNQQDVVKSERLSDFHTAIPSHRGETWVGDALYTIGGAREAR